MQIVQKPTIRALLRTTLATFTGLTLLTAAADPPHADRDHRGVVRTRMTINAGTTFIFDPNTGHHEVRGIAQVSNLGNCKVYFDVNAAPCSSGNEHFVCVAGTMTITTLAGDKLEGDVVGWGDPDPNDLKPTGPTLFKLHYDVTITGGTGKLAGARGSGDIDGAFMFSGPDGPGDADPTDDRFCDGYAGVATWLYEGVLILPRSKR